MAPILPNSSKGPHGYNPKGGPQEGYNPEPSRCGRDIARLSDAERAELADFFHRLDPAGRRSSLRDPSIRIISTSGPEVYIYIYPALPKAVETKVAEPRTSHFKVLREPRGLRPHFPHVQSYRICDEML